MGKAEQEIFKEIENLQARIKHLRDYFDELDNNHAHMQTVVAQDIAVLVAQLESLKKLNSKLGDK